MVSYQGSGLQIRRESLYVLEDRIRSRSGFVLFAYQQNNVGFALEQHIHDVLVLEMGVFAEFTHRTEDICLRHW